MLQNQVNRILRIEGSARQNDSIIRRLGDEVQCRPGQLQSDADLTTRDPSGDIGARRRLKQEVRI